MHGQQEKKKSLVTKYLVHEQQFYKWINIYSNVQDSNSIFIFMNLRMLKSSTSVWHTIWNPIYYN